MQQDNRHVPDWLLERLALGELDAETAADVRRRLAAEGRSADDIAAVVATSNREILEELPATATAAAIRLRAARTATAARPSRKRTALFTLPFALAGGLALTHMMFRQQTDEGVVSRVGENPEIILSKENTDPRLYVYRRGAGKNHRLKDGSAAARGDLLQLANGLLRVIGQHVDRPCGELEALAAGAGKSPQRCRVRRVPVERPYWRSEKKRALAHVILPLNVAARLRQGLRALVDIFANRSLKPLRMTIRNVTIVG